MTQARNNTVWLVGSRWLAIVLPWLVVVLVICPYCLCEYNGYVEGVLGGVVMLFLANVFLLPSPEFGWGCILFGFVLPFLALYLATKHWKSRRFWLAWLLYLAILAWDAWLGISIGKVISAFGTMSQ